MLRRDYEAIILEELLFQIVLLSNETGRRRFPAERLGADKCDVKMRQKRERRQNSAALSQTLTAVHNYASSKRISRDALCLDF